MKENFILILPPSHSLSWTWCYILCSIYHYLKLPYQHFSSFITSTFPLKVETLLVLFTAESQVLKMAPQHDKHLTDTGWVNTVLFLRTPVADRGFRKLHQEWGQGQGQDRFSTAHTSGNPGQQAASILSLITALRLGSQALAKPRKINTLKGTQERHQRMK